MNSISNINDRENVTPPDVSVRSSRVTFFVPDEHRDACAVALLQYNKIGTPTGCADGLAFECLSASETAQNPNPQTYRIWLGYNGVASCTCSDFEQRGGACKHLRAAILRLDQFYVNGLPILENHSSTSEDLVQALQANGSKQDSDGTAINARGAFDFVDLKAALTDKSVSPVSYDLNSDMEAKPHARAAPTQWDSVLKKGLTRPPSREIASDAIVAINPGLKDIPVTFIREQIQAIGSQLFTAAENTIINRIPGRLRHELEVAVNDISADPPTHIFAVYASPAQKQQISLHPVHALVLAASCANLRPLAPSNPATLDTPGATMTLPVVPCCVSSPATFLILLEYLYTARDDRLLALLLPLPSPHDVPSADQLTRLLTSAYSLPVLMTYVRRTYGLWANVVALGVCDESLWRVMGLAWEVLRGALDALTVDTEDPDQQL